MKLNKIVAGFVSAAFLSLSLVAPVAATPAIGIPVEEVTQVKLKTKYLMATGVVKEVKDYHADKNAKFISVVDENGAPSNIIVATDTYIVDNAEINEGTQVIYFYDATKPMIMIYPPQIKADVIAVMDDSRIIKVDIFNQDLVSHDYSLKLNISEDTEIILSDGTLYQGELAHHKLAVIYDLSTKSIPAQTNPKKVIVLDEVADNDKDLYDENYKPYVEKMNIVVDNDMVISSPKAYSNAEGVVMVPLRVIAEALGYEVGWNGDSQSITIGENVALKINSKTYTKKDSSIITLETAPALVNDTTYVPLNFFTDVLMMNNAYIFEGQIDINNGEKME